MIIIAFSEIFDNMHGRLNIIFSVYQLNSSGFLTLIPGNDYATIGFQAWVAELADARDLKSREGNLVGVRFPPSAHIKSFRTVR